MAKILNTLMSLLVVLNFSYAHAQKAESAKDLKQELSKEKLSPEEVDVAYDKLSAFVEAKKTTLSMKELLELCLLYFKHDGSDAAYDFVLDLKKSNQKEFDKALKLFSKEDAAKIKDFIKISEEAEKNGNG